MAETGYNWSSWTTLDAAIALTVGGTITDTSAEVDLDGKAACEVSIDTDYSDHAKATAGLTISILRTVDGTDWEDAADNPWSFEMPFTQNGTNRRVFAVDPKMIGSFKIQQDWGNTTASAVATTATKYRTATVPVAS